MPMFWEVWKFGCGCAVLAVILFGGCVGVATLIVKLIEAVHDRREKRRKERLESGYDQLIRVIYYLDRTYGYEPADARRLCSLARHEILHEMRAV